MEEQKMPCRTLDPNCFAEDQPERDCPCSKCSKTRANIEKVVEKALEQRNIPF